MLSSYWVHLVTTVPAVLARPLIQGERNDVVVRDETALRLFRQIQRVEAPELLVLTLALSGW